MPRSDFHLPVHVSEDYNERKLQFLFINKVRTRPVINPNTLKLITLIEKCTIKTVIKMSVARTKVAAVPFSGTVSAHTACKPHSIPTEPCSGPPPPSVPGTAKRTALQAWNGVITLVKRTRLCGSKALGHGSEHLV